MKEKNQNFFFELNLESDHCIKHAFWADARSRAAFDYFGDVVSFDTTYNTNRFSVPSKILLMFSGCYKGHIDIEQEMSHVVRNSYTKDDFDRNWNDFLTKYGLGGNKWFSELYEDRHIWIPVYLDHHFWAGMRSTQKSESMHSFFNKFIAQNSSLRQFVKQYDNCLTSREQADREFDAADFHTVIPCATKSAIETQFQRVYIHEKFREVQTQFRGKVNCITRSMHSTLGFTTYEVIEQVSNSTFNKFVITYDAVSRDVKCHCLLFESRGIFCRHSPSVLSFERVDNVAPKYILERWSKNIKRRHTHIKSSQDEPVLEPRSKRFDELVLRSHNICEFASEFEELTRILHREFDKVMAEMEEYQERRKEKSLLTHEEATLSNVNDLQSPPRIKTRGRPKNRLGSNLEKKI
ncbi:protein FAR-RED IMPAIRED RESPONSE 1-like [Arachis stenosperma]|uniref:protein FAR-RED IMPAIRED RESPONSE 1-like n=1 Tax=Arachis stenosperma TaxID=217475 RepID=UPI0025ACADD8|nr:protein FAR-RED IMPAIRED RESPONSE 1-like [Arachis stenosperma]